MVSHSVQHLAKLDAQQMLADFICLHQFNTEKLQAIFSPPIGSSLHWDVASSLPVSPAFLLVMEKWHLIFLWVTLPPPSPLSLPVGTPWDFHFAQSPEVLSCLLTFLCFPIHDLENCYSSFKIHFKSHLLLEMLPELIRQTESWGFCLDIPDSMYQAFLPDTSLLAWCGSSCRLQTTWITYPWYPSPLFFVFVIPVSITVSVW